MPPRRHVLPDRWMLVFSLLVLGSFPLLSADELPLPGSEHGFRLGMTLAETRAVLPEGVSSIQMRRLRIGPSEQSFLVNRYEFLHDGKRWTLDFYEDKLHHILLVMQSIQDLPVFEQWKALLGPPSRTTPNSLYWANGPRLWRASLDGRQLESATLEYLAEEEAFSTPMRSVILQRFGATAPEKEN